MAFSLLPQPLFSLSLSSTTAPVCATGSAAGPLATASTSHGNRNGKNSRATSNLPMAMGTREARVGISQHALESSRFARAQSRHRRSGSILILQLMYDICYTLRRELSEGLRPLHETFIALIRLYGSTGHATRGLEILAAMEKLNYDIRFQTTSARLDQMRNCVGFDNLAIKRQKLETGYLKKVALSRTITW